MDDLIVRVYAELDLDDAGRELWEPALPHLARALDGEQAAFLDAIEDVAHGAGLSQSIPVEALLGALATGGRGLREGFIASRAPDAHTLSLRLLALEPPALAHLAAGYIAGLEETIARLRADADKASPIDADTGAMRRQGIMDRLVVEAGRCQRMDQPLGLLELEFDGDKGVHGDAADGGGAVAPEEIGECLRANLRSYDSIGLAPEGGFLLVMPDISRRGLAGAAERLRRELGGCSRGRSLPRCHLALAHYDYVDVSPVEMLEALEHGMREARAQGEPLIWS